MILGLKCKAWYIISKFFRYENDKAKEIALLDFQGSKLNCPAYDVVYTIYSSTLPEFREKELENWMKTYYDQFSFDMKTLGYDLNHIYPYSQFQNDFDDLYEFGFVHAFLNSMVSSSLV